MYTVIKQMYIVQVTMYVGPLRALRRPSGILVANILVLYFLLQIRKF